MNEFTCPFRLGTSGDETPFKIGGLPPDHWREDDTCSYCGSLNPEVLMNRLEHGTVQLDPTDKNYKVYISNEGGEPFLQTYRYCTPNTCPNGPDECTHWTTRSINQTKFYFPHLSQDQKTRFIKLYNDGAIDVWGGGFYVVPYFCKRGR